MGPTQVQELPLNNRNFVQLATLVPGVNSSLADEVGIGLASTVSLSIDGARRNAVNWLVDGASNVDVGSNITLLSTPTPGVDRGVQDHHQLLRAPSGRAAAAASSTSSPSRARNTFRAAPTSSSATTRSTRTASSASRVGCTPARTSAHRRPPTSPSARTRPGCATTTSATRSAGPSRRTSCSSSARRSSGASSRAPTSTRTPTSSIRPGSPIRPTPTTSRPRCATRTRVRLLPIWPAPNLGADRFVASRPNDQDTRQEVARVDWHVNPKWRFMARYTHDLSRDDGAGRPLLQHARPRRRDHADQRARTALRGHRRSPRLSALAC